MDIFQITLLINYFALAAMFIYAYIKPEKWTQWLVSSYHTYYLVYAITIFIIPSVALIIRRDWFGLSMSLILVVCALWMIYGNLKVRNQEAIFPFLLFLFSIAQQVLWIIQSSDTTNAFIIVFVSYCIGIFFILFCGYLFGFVIKHLSKNLYDRHILMMKSVFGPNAPQVVRFADGSSAENLYPPNLIGMGIAYCIWMIFINLFVLS